VEAAEGRHEIEKIGVFAWQQGQGRLEEELRVTANIAGPNCQP
jgi:hypothetical protein